MDQDGLSQRNGAKSRKRPLSRGSTASIHSATTQPTVDHSGFPDAQDMYAGQWMDASAHQKALGAPPQMTPEDMILHAATHMQAAGHDFSVNAAMSAHMGHHNPFQQHDNISRHPLPAEQFGPNASFTEADSQMLDREDNEEGDPMAALVGAPKPTGSKSSANNELEMRQLFGANRHRSLQDVASELHGNERGPNSERARQVFAMLWINSVCEKGKGSVPRGRVYANYASRCATERITVLNPASFGKLVRVLFPGLKTRRLGVRGESKYHYVNFTLLEDQPDLKEPSPQQPRSLPEPKRQEKRSSTVPPQAGPNWQGGALPSPEDATNILSVTSRAAHKPSFNQHSIYHQPNLESMDDLKNASTKTPLGLSFLAEEDETFNHSDPLPLPQISPYLPKGTDPDAAKSLSALYRSHCTSLVECIRFCKEKTFFHLYQSFQGTLTMPVQKLFGHPDLAPWIEGCDLVLYQRLMKILSNITLQVLPKQILDTLRNISERLVSHVRLSFQGQPQHVIRAKEAPAVVFAALLDRALRVNLTAHAAANMLSNPANRDQMYLDWITMIRVRKVAECVPTRGMDDVVQLIIGEMRNLLDPTQIPSDVEALTIYGEVVARDGNRPSMANPNADGNSVEGTENVLDKWVAFLRSLPDRFPYASHSEIVWCVERVGTAVMRDLTLAQGKSYGTWWVTKVWIDEMVCFLAEHGGFMKQGITYTAPAQDSHPSAAQQGNRKEVGNSDAAVSMKMPQVTQPQLGRAPFPPANHDSQPPASEVHGVDAHDDSGIGIRTPEEDFTMDKFEFSMSEAAGLVTGPDLTA
ncbi:unnamed protein product [Clonostachys byssicola]|uniref:RFX-type winged-helix domain-containing protein n=1 Tax=Clonostachys byssicola TaxID=160290 RepID=A0A9N9UU00_9HYPO|nr:unnamed protein product [Clonostachys byssicola]